MGGEGHMMAMIQRIKENQALRKSRREKFKYNQDLYTTGLNEALEFKEVSPEKLVEIKQRNLEKIKQEELMRFLKFIGIVFIIGIISFLLFGI